MAVPIDRVIQEALKLTGLKDVTIEDPSMEEVIRILYGKGINPSPKQVIKGASEAKSN
jgi:hypothetical protein